MIPNDRRSRLTDFSMLVTIRIFNKEYPITSTRYFQCFEMYYYTLYTPPLPPFPPSSRSHPRQTSTPLTRENSHNPKPHIKQPQRICNESSHTPHPPHSTEHLAATIRTPADRQHRNHIPSRRIHRQNHAYETRQYQWQQTVSQHRRTPWKRQR